MTNVPDKFIVHPAARPSKTYLVELQDDGRYRLSWDSDLGDSYSNEPRECFYDASTVQKLVKDGRWINITDLTVKPLTFTEKAKALQLTVALHDSYISVHNVSVKTPADLEKLVDFLYEARRD